MMMMMMMLMMIVSFFFNESLLAICFVLSSHWLCPWGPKASRNEAQMRQAVDPVATNEATDGDVDLPNREKHHGVDQKSPGTILVAGSSRWPFQASIQGHFTPKKGHLTTSNGSLWRSWYTFVGIDVPFLGDVFQTLTNICWRWNIPNSWVMFNWDIYQALI